MRKILFVLLISYILCGAVISGCASNEKALSSDITSGKASDTPAESTSVSENTAPSQAILQPTEEPTKAIFDVTKAYTSKPYTNDFALERVDELQYIDDNSLCYLCSTEPSPIFYEGFYHENDTFKNVNMETYTYERDSETLRKYCDTYEYSILASAGALRVIDSFVYTDSSNDRMLYYCYYTITNWSEGESCDTLNYYRDVITVNKDNTIDVQNRIAIRKDLEIPKEITGDHDFHNVI